MFGSRVDLSLIQQVNSMFNRNVGSIDKIIRLVAGVALAAWGVLGAGLATTLGLVATVVGAVLIVTGAFNFCPLFKILGISSSRGK